MQKNEEDILIDKEAYNKNLQQLNQSLTNSELDNLIQSHLKIQNK